MSRIVAVVTIFVSLWFGLMVGHALSWLFMGISAERLMDRALFQTVALATAGVMLVAWEWKTSREE